MDQSKTNRTWTVAEAKARLSEILRLAEEEGPQHIGTDRPFVVVSAEAWYAQDQPQVQSQQQSRKPMGQWLVENMPRGIDLELPSRRESERPIPFVTQPDK